MDNNLWQFYPSCSPVIWAPKFFCSPNGCISYWQSSPTRQNSSLQSFSTDHFEYASWKRHSQVLMRIRKVTKKRSILITNLPFSRQLIIINELIWQPKISWISWSFLSALTTIRYLLLLVGMRYVHTFQKLLLRKAMDRFGHKYLPTLWNVGSKNESY